MAEHSEKMKTKQLELDQAKSKSQQREAAMKMDLVRAQEANETLAASVQASTVVCKICFQQMIGNDDGRHMMAAKCGHALCSTCANNLINRNRTVNGRKSTTVDCPWCRGKSVFGKVFY